MVFPIWCDVKYNAAGAEIPTDFPSLQDAVNKAPEDLES